MVAYIILSIKLFSVFLFGAAGEIITEKSGHLNLGTPGVMCFGAVGGGLGISIYCSWVGGPNNANAILVVLFGIVFALLFGAALGLLYSFLTVTRRANQNITGLALTTFGVALTNMLKKIFEGELTCIPQVSSYFTTILNHFIPEANTPDAVRIFFSHGILVILAVVIAVLASIVMKKTKVGLALRAVGESPATADAQGIDVAKYKYVGTMIGCAICALGGLSYIMNIGNGQFDQAASIENIGWLAVALVIFSVWKPNIAILGSLIFSFLYQLPQALAIDTVTTDALNMLPYLVTIIVLIGTSIVGKKNIQPPLALGINYFREDR
jgi:simple sugar transport system permease protein